MMPLLNFKSFKTEDLIKARNLLLEGKGDEVISSTKAGGQFKKNKDGFRKIMIQAISAEINKRGVIETDISETETSDDTENLETSDTVEAD